MPSSRAAAIAELRREQQLARERYGRPTPITAGDALQKALAKAVERESAARVDGEYIYSSNQAYPLMTETLRWARTREVISRVSPGGDEDPIYLEFIARQAASIEMLLRREHTGTLNPPGVDLCNHVLLATLPALAPDANQRRCGDYYFVWLSAGLIEFVYQAAKATVFSWASPGSEPVGWADFKKSPEEVDAQLAIDAYPVTLLSRTLQEFLFRGRPRISDSKPPPLIYDGPLMQLTNSNERFVIAHEYGHVMHEASDTVLPGDGAKAEEFGADWIAFQLVAESGDLFDLLPPAISLQGAFFVLTALDIIRRALDLARHGEERADPDFVGHPPIGKRLAALQSMYVNAVPEGAAGLRRSDAFAAARTLRQLWDRACARGLRESFANKPLDAIWQGVQ